MLFLRQIYRYKYFSNMTSNEIRQTFLDFFASKGHTIVPLLATIPIICVYPFLQKYFVKGVLIGSLKG